MTALVSGTVVFDLDGTLVDSAPDLAGTLDTVLVQNALEPVGLDAARRMIGHGIDNLVRQGFESRGVSLAGPALQEATETFLTIYSGRLARLTRPYPGAEEALAALQEAGWRLVVCTNKREAAARGLLADLGLLARFSLVAGPDTFGTSKPDPAHVLRCLPGDGRPAILVGDSAVDLDAGKGAGVPVVIVGWGYARQPIEAMGADAVVERFDEVPGAVDRLAGQARAGGPSSNPVTDA